MKTIDEKEALKQTIITLRNKQADDFFVLKQQYHTTIDSFKPVNLIKNSIQEVLTSPNLKANLMQGAIALGTNYISNKVFFGNANHPVKRVLGSVYKAIVNRFS
jgi:hypothetical protein